jgi:large subunit ribosomal protein L31
MTRHPELHLVDVVCATCGAEHTLRSTAAGLHVEVCSSCHPAYTGAQQAAASGSRVERFNRRRALASSR